MISITPRLWEEHKKEIVVDDFDESREFETSTIYFRAPVSIANGCTPRDVSVEISMEFPTVDDRDYGAEYADVNIAPTKEVDGEFIDYDWVQWEAPYEYINYLLELFYRYRYARNNVRLKPEGARRLFAEISIDEGVAEELAKNLGIDYAPIDWVDREAGWLAESGISIPNCIVADYDDVDAWSRYLNYLIGWAMSHTGEEYTGESPYDFTHWLEHDN